MVRRQVTLDQGLEGFLASQLHRMSLGLSTKRVIFV